MADRSVTRDDGNDNWRWMEEPALYRRWRRVKEVWRAFRFLLKGGKFKIVLDFSGVDPFILKQPWVYIGADGQVVNLENERHNARAATWSKALVGLRPADADDPDGFRVKWADTARENAREGTSWPRP